MDGAEARPRAAEWSGPVAVVGAVAVLAVVGSALDGWGVLLRDVGGAVAAAGIVLGVRRNRPVPARPWYLLAAGIGCWVAGDVVWDVLGLRGQSPASYHHLADWLYLAGYPLLGAALVEIVRARSGGHDRGGLLDGTILAVAGVILVWSFLIVPQGGGGGSLLDEVLLAAYPLADGLLLAGIAWIVLTPGRVCASLWLLGGALATVFLTDLAWDLAARSSITGLETALDPWYVIGYSLVAAAALHPSVRTITEPAPRDDHVHSARLVFLGLALFTGPLVALTQSGTFGNTDVMLSACSLAVAGLVVGRFLGLVRQNERAEDRFRLMAENVPVGIYEIGADYEITFANAAADELFGNEIEGTRAPSLLARLDPEYRDQMIVAAANVFAGEYQEVEFRLEAGDGTTRWVRWRGTPGAGDAASPSAFASTEDITALMEAYRKEERQATHDPLTGLPNRRFLSARLGEAITRLRRRPGTLAVMFLDLDHFKLVNDVLGHDAGDALLVEVACRLEGAVRESDTVARIGGDEFIVLCEQAGSRRALAELAGRIVAAVGSIPIEGDDDVRVGASVGIALAGPDDDADALLRDADSAMYRAKTEGRGRYRFFDTPDGAEVAGGVPDRRVVAPYRKSRDFITSASPIGSATIRCATTFTTP